LGGYDETPDDMATDIAEWAVETENQRNADKQNQLL